MLSIVVLAAHFRVGVVSLMDVADKTIFTFSFRKRRISAFKRVLRSAEPQR